MKQNSNHDIDFLSNYSLLMPYIGPYFAYVFIASIFSDLSPSLNYSIRIIVVTSLMLYFWRWYIPFRGPKSTTISVLYGIIVGSAGTIFWIIGLKPFVDEEIKSWSTFDFFLRLIASSLLVPIFEELLMRVYIFRVAFQWSNERKKNKTPLDKILHKKSINNFEPGAWNVTAILVSTLVFTLGHRIYEFPAAILYGILMIFLWVKRKDLISCMVAHGTTNLTLGLYVGLTGHWELW